MRSLKKTQGTAPGNRESRHVELGNWGGMVELRGVGGSLGWVFLEKRREGRGEGRYVL